MKQIQVCAHIVTRSGMHCSLCRALGQWPPRFEIQHGYNIDGYRITDTHGDNRIATAYAEENAILIVKALNSTIEL